MTTAMITITGTSWENKNRSNSPGTRLWPVASIARFGTFGERKMKNATRPIKTPRRVTVASRTIEEHISRSLDRARKLDHGERLSSEITMTFEDPSDLVRVLSAERVRILHAVRTKPAPVSELAVTLK